MSRYETIAIPFQIQGDRQFLSEQQLMEMPELRNFMERFPHCFEHDPVRCVWWFYPDSKPECP